MQSLSSENQQKIHEEFVDVIVKPATMNIAKCFPSFIVKSCNVNRGYVLHIQKKEHQIHCNFKEDCIVYRDKSKNDKMTTQLAKDFTKIFNTLRSVIFLM